MPCPPDCEECAEDREREILDREDDALDVARRFGVRTLLEPRRETLSRTLQAARKCDRCPPHGDENRKPGTRRPRK
jgi:hypothetical protein